MKPRRRHSSIGFISLLSAMIATIATLSCSDSDNPGNKITDEEFNAILLDQDTMVNPYDVHFDSMPAGGVRFRISREIRSLPSQFRDNNPLHLAAAASIGIDPATSFATSWQLRRPLVRIRSCREYFVDSLTHSLPFLVPEAEQLLRDIGRTFIDSLQARGGGDYRIKVTSVMRTPMSVKQLRRRNRNATEQSAHLHGTTFDISYSKFICDSANTVPRTAEHLKLLLAETLLKLKNEGRCYVKYERKQSCFHITVRPTKSDNIQPHNSQER